MEVINLDPECSGSTNLHNLIPQNHVTENLPFYVPSPSIVDHDCCINIRKMYNSSFSERLQPMKLTNVVLNELKFAAQKFNEFDKIITRQTNQPFVMEERHWYWLALSFCIVVILLYVGYNCCIVRGYFSLISRCCCYRRNATTGAIAVPAITDIIARAATSTANPSNAYAQVPFRPASRPTAPEIKPDLEEDTAPAPPPT